MFGNLYITLLIFTAIIFQSCISQHDKTEGYTLKGNIEGIDSGKAFLAKLDLVSNESVYVDSAEIQKGKFTFSGKTESPYLHTMFINDESNKIHFFLENSDIEIAADINNLELAKITGSREDSLFHSYNMDDIFDRNKGMDIMLNYPDYAFAAFTAYYQFQIYNIHADTLKLIIQGFKEPVTKSVYYAHLVKLYDTLERVAISKPAPKFTIPDTKGNLISLDDFKGTYVLIDFWASWCAPCRAANPKLVHIYNTFSNRNFTIVGISVDRDKDGWIKAIQTDKLPWLNLSNLKGWDEVSDNYGVKAIPQNFLLDPDGIIIDRNLEAEKMFEKLNLILPEK